MVEAESYREVDKPAAENVYGLSTANVLDEATILAAFTWGIQDHVDMATKSGYNGVELWPQRFRPLLQIRVGKLSSSERKGIISAHQSARDAIPHSRQELQKTIFLPETVASTRDLEVLFDRIGDIPVVLFKENPTEYMDHFDRLDIPSFTQRGIQTDPETATLWNSRTEEEYLAHAFRYGFNEIIIDTHHIRRSDKHTGEPNPLRNWQTTIPVLLPYTHEIHVSVGRSNFGDLDPKVIKQEADDMLSGGHNNTELIKMLRLIADQGWKGRVVLEMRPSIYRETIGNKRFLTEKDLVSIYQAVRKTLYEIFDE